MRSMEHVLAFRPARLRCSAAARFNRAIRRPARDPEELTPSEVSTLRERVKAAAAMPRCRRGTAQAGWRR